MSGEPSFMFSFFSEVSNIRKMLNSDPVNFEEIRNKLLQLQIETEKLAREGHDKTELQIRSNMISTIYRRIEENENK